MSVRRQDISLYIPARDTARTIAAAIESVRRQTVAPARFFVLLDTRSGDETVDIVRASGVEIVEQNTGRLGHGRNLAIEACRTPWLASCDADVTLEREWLEALLRAANQPARGGARLAAVGGGTREALHTRADAWRAVNMPHNWGPAGFDNPFMLVSEMMARVDALRAIGGYLPDLRYGEDSDMCQRLRHADFTLRYTPKAVAWHDRRDTPGSVLDLRWAYSYHRQRPRFESVPGLCDKLAINRSYVIQSLSQTLHSEQADTVALSVAIWFHHALRDLREALRRWPLLDAEFRAVAEMRLWATLCDAAPACLCAALRRFAGWIGVDDAARPAGDDAFALGDEREAAGASLLSRYDADARRATAQLFREIPEDTLAAVMRSAIAIDRGERVPGSLGPRPIGTRRAPVVFRTDRPTRCAWDWQTIESILCADAARYGADTVTVMGPVAPSETPAGAQSSRPAEAPNGTVLAPHLELAGDPLAALDVVLAQAEQVAVGYLAPARFDPAALFLTPRDIAARCAEAGFEILDFYAEAGLTRVIARRGRVPTDSQVERAVSSPVARGR